MSETETILAMADEPRQRRSGRGPDKAPRRAKFRPEAVIAAAGEAGYSKVTIDTDGKITVERGAAADLPDDKGENPWNELHKLADDE